MLILTTDKLNIQLTKEGADIFEPMKRRSDRSLPVEIPSTPEMDELFANAFEINMTLRDEDWNPNLKAACILNSTSGLPLLKGYAQWVGIVRENQAVIYQVVLYGATKELFTNIGEKLLVGNDDPDDDLDFSEYEHDYNISKIEDSWGYLCDVNGTPTDLTGDGEGYVYPMIDYGVNAANIRLFYTKDWRPALYYREILFKIFEEAGMSWDSDFLDSAMFKQLIMPFSGEKFMITSDRMAELSASAARNAGSGNQERSFYNTPSQVNQPDRSTGEKPIFDVETLDASSQYDTTLGEFTADEDMEIIVEGNIKGIIKYIGASNQWRFIENAPSFEHDAEFRYEIIKDSGGGSYTPIASFTCRSTFTATNGVIPGFDVLINGDFSAEIAGQGYFRTSPFILKSGEKCYIKYDHYFNDDNGTRYVSYTQFKAVLKEGAFINFLRTSSVVPNTTLDPTTCLPERMKQKDFVSNVIKRFNLHMEPIDEHVLKVEPRNDFYTSDTEDWSELLDTVNPLVFHPMGLLNAKQYHFNHARDDDYINKHYQDRWGHIFGTRQIFIENEFLKNTEEINDNIAPTPSVNQLDRIIPSITYTGSAGGATYKGSKLRMLYYAGLIDCIESWENNEYDNITVYNQYPHAGLQDSLYDPTLNLTFGNWREWYYDRYPGQDPLKYSTNTLYHAYWRKTIEEITNKNSRVVTGFFWIDALTYYKASLRKQYWFNNAYHRLLKIEDWVATEDISLTKCTFLKLEAVQLPAATQGDNTGGTGNNGDGSGVIDHTRLTDKARTAGDNSGTSTGTGGVLTGGSGEKYAGLVNSGPSVFGPEVENITILGGIGAVIPAKSSNITMINSSLPPLDNDTAVLNDLPIFQTIKVEVDAAALGNIDTTPLQIITNGIEGAIVDILEAYGMMIYGTSAFEDVTLTLQNDTGTDLYTFGTGFTNSGANKRRKAERIDFDLLLEESINLKASAPMTTGDGSLFLVINYRIIQL